MQFTYKQLMETADVSLPNAIGMHIMSENPHMGFLANLIEKFGPTAVQEAFKDAELVTLMDTIEQQSNSISFEGERIKQYAKA